MKQFSCAKPGKQLLGWGLFFATLLCSPVSGGQARAGGAEVPPAILASFEHFSKGWMARLDQVSQQNSRTLKPETAANGRVVGHYICYGPDCSREVRSTGSKATPYVGILRYPQKTMQQEGDTSQQMRQDPGVPTSEIQVTEIFRYTKGRWVY